MVGVPGRSFGCGECLRRHIKCDEAKPACRNCKKTKCPGYEREIIFVHFDAEDERPSATYRPPRKHAASRTSSQPSLAVEAKRKDRMPRVKQKALVRCSRPQNFPSTLNTDRDHLMRLFLAAYLPKSTGTSEGQNYGISWAQYLPASEHMDDTLREALHAVSSVMVGRSYNDKFLIDQSTSYYNAAIIKLNNAIGYASQRTQLVGVADIMGAMMALSNFELMRPDSGDNINKWVLHTTGAASILARCCKISKYPTPMEKALLIHVKTNCIFDAMSRRKATFMANKEWRNKFMKADEPDDALRNIIVRIPTLLEETDKNVKTFHELGIMADDACYALLFRYQEIDKKLDCWHATWADNPRLYWPDPMLVPLDVSEDNYFDIDLSFPSLLTAQMMTSYWSSRALIQDAMETILRTIRDSQVREHTVELGDGRFRIVRPVPTTSFSIEIEGQAEPISIVGCNDLAIHYANLVCRSVRFSTALDHQFMGIQATSQPLWLAQQIFRGRDAAKSAWCLRFSKIIATRGLGMMERISNDFNFNDYARSTKPCLDDITETEIFDVSDDPPPDIETDIDLLQIQT